MNPRWHPLWRVSQLPWLTVVVILLGLTAVNAGLGLAAGGRKPLRDTGRPIVALELHPSHAAEILATWSVAKVLPLAREAVAWDFPFIAGYVSALSIACLAFTRRGGWFLTWGARFGWLSLLAGGLDLLENYGLWQMILRAEVEGVLGEWPRFTAFFAWPKWILVLAAGVFLAAATWRALRWETGAAAETAS